MAITISRARAEFVVYWVVGVLVPVPFFLAPGLGFTPTVGYVNEAPLSFPLSLFFLPPALVWTFLNYKVRLNRAKFYFLLSTLAISAISLVLGLMGFSKSSEALLFGLQWALLLPWFIVFFCINSESAVEGLLKGFVVGTMLAIAYISLSAVLEFFLYGGLLDSGRVTQNLTIPGQYQLYVYTPTAIAFCSIFSAAFLYNCASGIGSVWQARIILVFGFVALLALGAREGLLIFVIGFGVLFFAGRVMQSIAAALLAVLVCVAYLAYSELVISALQASELRMAGKVAEILTGERLLAGRDEMVASYLSIFLDNPLLGAMMVQPSIAPSAHNYYVDALAWGGLGLGAAVLAFLLLSVGFCLSRALRFFTAQDRGGKMIYISSCLVIIFLLVSNNVNVPMRQPLTIPIFMIMLVASVGWSNAFWTRVLEK